MMGGDSNNDRARYQQTNRIPNYDESALTRSGMARRLHLGVNVLLGHPEVCEIDCGEKSGSRVPGTVGPFSFWGYAGGLAGGVRFDPVGSDLCNSVGTRLHGAPHGCCRWWFSTTGIVRRSEKWVPGNARILNHEANMNHDRTMTLRSP